MVVPIICLIFVFVMKVSPGAGVPFLTPKCDSSRVSVDREGALGETRTFPWLGILRVHQHEHGSLKVALTGIVLVKHGYAVGFADDLARVHKRVLQDSKAMFIPRDGEPWYCAVRDYMTHPEYEYRTMSTIALLELDAGDGNMFPMMPICWSSYAFNAANQLYAVGYTDENQLLEKSFHKMVYVEQNLCMEFYNRAGIAKDDKMEPIHVQCGFAVNNNKNCIWDNGMALISNASSKWTLIGLGLRGPGCAAPARFIDLLPYYEWIEAASDLQEIADLDETRRSEGSILKPELWNNNITEDLQEDMNRMSLEITEEGTELSIPIKRSSPNHPHNVTRAAPNGLWTMTRESPTAISIRRNVLGYFCNCSEASNVLLYKDEIKVLATHSRASNATGSVRYKISMNDLIALNFTCVKIKVNSLRSESAYLKYSAELSVFRDPVDLIKHLLRPTESWATTKSQPITDNPFKIKANNIKDPTAYDTHILLEISFVNEALLEITVYGMNGTVHEMKSKYFERTPKTRQQRMRTEGDTRKRGINENTTKEYENHSFNYKSGSIMEKFAQNKISWTKAMLPNISMVVTKSDGSKSRNNVISEASIGRPERLALVVSGLESGVLSEELPNAYFKKKVAITSNETFKSIITDDSSVKLSVIEKKPKYNLTPKSMAVHDFRNSHADVHSISNYCERNNAHLLFFVVLLFILFTF